MRIPQRPRFLEKRVSLSPILKVRTLPLVLLIFDILEMNKGQVAIEDLLGTLAGCLMRVNNSHDAVVSPLPPDTIITRALQKQQHINCKPLITY